MSECVCLLDAFLPVNSIEGDCRRKFQVSGLSLTIHVATLSASPLPESSLSSTRSRGKTSGSSTRSPSVRLSFNFLTLHRLNFCSPDLPLDLRYKKTRAIRRRLTTKEASAITEKQHKKNIHFPKRSMSGR